MYTLYIGSNNETEKLEMFRIVEMVGTYFDSFTYYQVQGYWKGYTELSLKVEILTEDKEKVYKLTEDLKGEFLQESVLVSFVESVNKFV